MKNKLFLKSQTWLLFACTFYFQYLSTFIFTVLLILKYRKIPASLRFFSINILIGDFHFYRSHFPVRYLYFYSRMDFGYFTQDCIHHIVARHRWFSLTKRFAQGVLFWKLAVFATMSVTSCVQLDVASLSPARCGFSLWLPHLNSG